MLPASHSVQSPAAGSYTDFAALARLRTDARRDAGATLDEVARQFESMFMQMMLKSMREAGFGDPLTGSREVEFYQGMLDDQLSVELSRNGSLGIADMLKRQLTPLVNGPGAGEGADGTRGTAGELAPPLRTFASRRPPAAVAPAAVHGADFPDRQAFIDALRPAAEEAARRLGVPAGLLLAQVALETGWGRAVPRHPDGSSSHNLFGIKADGRWDGPRVSLSTVEFRDGVAQREQAAFRAYDSYAASFQDYVAFLQSGARYTEALERAPDASGFMRGLHEAGYATDPRYADKVLAIWQRDLNWSI
ncbi:MAG: flagellar assembly peptidoglycan hydrolase FlgJ [Gammaproteobacteria bacterium]|nr:flagellar assembly peptidoglycan hydrolase FlgJ [Gammaproteobacteria bacterium]